jgi:hypothetical protein
MKLSLVAKLLGRHINAWQLAGFVLANLFGMAIILGAIQVYHDITPIFTGSDSFMRPSQMVLTKHVSAFNTFTGAKPVFHEGEIEELKEQPFVESVGRFTSSQFAVYASVKVMGATSFGTEMFFEAVPDEFLDVNPSEWKYQEGSNTVPIILPHTYLNLYNFGFASSQGLPTVTEGIISQIPIDFQLSGTQGVTKRTGHIVAFSRRLNTILVPQRFIDEMNRTLSPDRKPHASRLIISAPNPADERLATYLSKHNYEAEGNDADASRIASMMRLLTTIVIVVGLIITALSFYVLLLSIFLLLQKNTEKIDNLLLIGYSPASVARPFHLLTLSLNAFVLVAALVIVQFLRQWYLPLFGEIYPGVQAAESLPTLLTGLSLFLLVSILNFLAIRRKVNGVWHLHEKN